MELREQTREWESFGARFRQIEENVERVLRGKNAEIRLALVALGNLAAELPGDHHRDVGFGAIRPTPVFVAMPLVGPVKYQPLSRFSTVKPVSA